MRLKFQSLSVPNRSSPSSTDPCYYFLSRQTAPQVQQHHIDTSLSTAKTTILDNLRVEGYPIIQHDHADHLPSLHLEFVNMASNLEMALAV